MAAAPSEPAPCSACSSTVDPPPSSIAARSTLHGSYWGPAGSGWCTVRAVPTLRAVLRMKHLGRLVGSFASYAVVNRVWWILPLMAVLGLFGIVIAVGQAAAPYTIYTLF